MQPCRRGCSPVGGRSAAAAALFLALVMPLYTCLELPGDGGTLCYFGQAVGGTASGEGRAFDRDRRLVYSGGFKDGSYSGWGRTYLPDGTVDRSGWFEDGAYRGPGPETQPNSGPGHTIQSDGNSGPGHTIQSGPGP